MILSFLGKYFFEITTIRLIIYQCIKNTKLTEQSLLFLVAAKLCSISTSRFKSQADDITSF